MLADEFKIHVSDCPNGAVLVKLAGFLDAHTYERLDQAIARLFAEKRFRLIVDLAGVGYVSSAGAGVFIGALTDAQDQNGNVVLLSPIANVREVLEMLGFNQIFKIALTLDEAMSAV
ncbi:MAG: STAS domain-containing protein [Planctomycetota bacterium]